jgi:hypothetical protein
VPLKEHGGRIRWEPTVGLVSVNLNVAAAMGQVATGRIDDVTGLTSHTK